MAGRYPRSRNLDEFWNHLRDGKELISFFTDEEVLARGVDPEILASGHFVKPAKMCNTFGVYLPLHSLFDKPTIAGLAENVEMHTSGRCSSANRIKGLPAHDHLYIEKSLACPLGKP